MSIEYTANPGGISSVISPCSSAGPSDPEPAPLPPVNIRISVFIDGTRNNLFNTRSFRDRNSAWYNRTDGGDSFVNDYSNVAKMAMNLNADCSDNNYHLFIYVEGIGSTHGRGDNSVGSAVGDGTSGIITRVSNCIVHIRSRINTLTHGNMQIGNLKIDAFGFSRGAAAARFFVHRVLEPDPGVCESLIYQLQTQDHYSITNYKMPFIGLYDTVASFGVNHADDRNELHLDAIVLDPVETVVQLCAGDEHRFNFPLTDIQSAIQASAGQPGKAARQIFLPGVHSDIGGGYNDITEGHMREVDLVVFEIEQGTDTEKQTRCVAMKDFLVRLGWYTSSELQIFTNPYRLVAGRISINNRYCRVPLHIMAEKAGEQGLSFDLTEPTCIISDDPFLEAIKQRIENNTSSAETWLNAPRVLGMDPQLTRLRHQYLHFSARYNDYIVTQGFTHGPQFCIPGIRWLDNDTQTLHGERKRQIYQG